MFFSPLQIYDGMLVTMKSKEKHWVCHLCFCSRNMSTGSESGSKKTKGSIAKRPETFMDHSEAGPGLWQSGLGEGLVPGK